MVNEIARYGLFFVSLWTSFDIQGVKPIQWKGIRMLEYDRKKLGDFLRQTREQSNFTQADVSSRLGYTSPQFISNIERGISVVPLKTLARMVQLYKVNPEIVVKIILESQKKLLREKLTRSR